MGVVYQLLPIAPYKPILALKTHKGISNLKSFARKARVWIALGAHPRIAEAIAFGQIEQGGCILSMWYERNLLSIDPTQLPFERVLQIIEGIVDGLSFALERQSLVHKDVKPTNILIDKHDNPRIADFGISTFDQVGVSAQGVLAAFSKVLQTADSLHGLSGTPAYMAPELFCGVKSTCQTDIYALCVSVYEWMLGKHPFIGSDGRLDISRAHVVGQDIIDKYGPAFAPIAKMVDLATCLSPSDRPINYEHLMSQSGLGPHLSV